MLKIDQRKNPCSLSLSFFLFSITIRAFRRARIAALCLRTARVCDKIVAQ